MSLKQIVESLSKEQEVDFMNWYDKTMEEYRSEFGAGQIETDRDSAIMFFRDAFIWWFRRKPEPPKEGPMTKLDIIKTRTCLIQISELKKKISATDIQIGELRIADHL